MGSSKIHNMPLACSATAITLVTMQTAMLNMMMLRTVQPRRMMGARHLRSLVNSVISPASTAIAAPTLYCEDFNCVAGDAVQNLLADKKTTGAVCSDALATGNSKGGVPRGCSRRSSTRVVQEALCCAVLLAYHRQHVSGSMHTAPALL